MLIVRMIEEEGVTHFISGMAQGVDLYAAEIVLELKEQYPQITLECAIPYEQMCIRDRLKQVVELPPHMAQPVKAKVIDGPHRL